MVGSRLLLWLLQVHVAARAALLAAVSVAHSTAGCPCSPCAVDPLHNNLCSPPGSPWFTSCCSFTDLGMQKILPDTSFLAQWRDKIEAVVITHGRVMENRLALDSSGLGSRLHVTAAVLGAFTDMARMAWQLRSVPSNRSSRLPDGRIAC